MGWTGSAAQGVSSFALFLLVFCFRRLPSIVCFIHLCTSVESHCLNNFFQFSKKYKQEDAYIYQWRWSLWNCYGGNQERYDKDNPSTCKSTFYSVHTLEITLNAACILILSKYVCNICSILCFLGCSRPWHLNWASSPE